MKFKIVLLGIICCTPLVWSFGSDRVLLRDISAITLHQGQMTAGRRSSPVPQLKCVGGNAGCHSFVPNTVQCRNVGFDGYDVQWECKADMDDTYRFGKIQVTCEGYDYPDDPYVLRGSCGLEYSIDVTDAGKARNQNSWNNHGSTYLKHGDQSSGSWFLVFLVVGAIVFLIYKMSSTPSDDRHSNRSTEPRFGDSHPRNSNQPPPYGFKPGYSQYGTNYEPPPTYSDATGTHTRSSTTTNTNGGFWSGMGLGGIAGYLFGSRRNSYGYGYHNTPRNYGWGNYGTGWGSSGWGNNRGWGSSWQSGTRTTYRGSSSSSSGTSRTASGFGGTSRR